MAGPDPLRLGVEAYAALVAALAEGDRPREAILADHDLDEASWSAVDRAFQDELSRAIDAEADGVPPLVMAYAAAFERARAAARREDQVISLERFAEATREIQRRGDPTAALSRAGVSLADFLRANEHWTRRMIEDPALLARFRGKLGK